MSQGSRFTAWTTPRVDPAAFLTRWSQAHSVLVVLAALLAAWAGFPPLLGWVAGGSFVMLIALSRGTWTPEGQFGSANLVTSVRLAMTLGLLFAHQHLDNGVVAVSAVAILVLDGLDGWLARRFGRASAFGARYDVEVDALFVMALSGLLLARGVAGAWVLAAGLLRYIYILGMVIIPSPIEAPRTLFGRLCYVLVLVCFVLSLLVPPAWSSAVAALGTGALCVSFLRSWWQCYFPESAP